MHSVVQIFKNVKCLTRHIQTCRCLSFRVTGHSGAPYTPMKENGEINFDFDFDGCTQYLREVQKFECLFVNGSSGESVSLNVDERKELARKWKTASMGRIPMILHIGTGNLKDTKALARDAEELGVEAMAMVSPSYFRPQNEEALVDYISDVTSAAPSLPMFYYSIDFMTNVYLNDVKVMTIAKEKVPTLAGMKYTTSDLVSAFSCMQIDNKLQILVGTDTLFLPCLSLGLNKPIMSPFMGDLFHNTKEAFDSGNIEKARDIQKSVVCLNSIRMKYGTSFSIAKAMFSILSGFAFVSLPTNSILSYLFTKTETRRLEGECIRLGVTSTFRACRAGPYLDLFSRQCNTALGEDGQPVTTVSTDQDPNNLV